MSTSPLNLLARLVFKNHQELQALMGTRSSLCRDPLDWVLSLAGNSISMTVRFDQESGSRITLLQHPWRYTLEVPAKVHSLDETKVRITLERAHRPPRVVELLGKELLTFVPGDEFAELHATALQHVKEFYSLGTQGRMVEPLAESSAPESPGTVTTSSTDAVPAIAPQTPPVEEFQWVTLERDNAPNLRFKGKVLVRIGTPVRNGRQRVYTVYQTEGGKRVAVNTGVTFWVRERDIQKVAVIANDAELVAFFGYDALAKYLYQELGLTDQAEELIS